jgi:ketosteroid isomerase-like protein
LCGAGSKAVRKYIREWPVAFDEFRGDVQELIDRGDYVVAPMIVRAVMKGTDTEITMPETQVWKLVEGKVIAVREYHDREEALNAVHDAITNAAAELAPARSRAA